MSESRRTVEERLFALLPELHRVRDADQGEPLRALLAILEHELLAVRDDTQGLYEDWFIETCKEWAVPYLGDLLGVELIRSIEAEGFTSRAYIANTLAYRRRKGTATALEQLARDVTGWPARAVEYFQRLATTQNVQHVRLHAPVTVSLRKAERLELVDGPFGAECHTAEVRSITLGRGRFNIPNVGLHLWRLRPYPLERVDARPVTSVGVEPGRYHFDPLGLGGPLFNLPRAETDILHLAEERDVPAPLRRRALHAELAGDPPSDGWLGEQPVLRVIRVDGAGAESTIAVASLGICNLEIDDPATDWPRPPSGRVHLDPETGRLVVPAPAVEATPAAVIVHHVYGFSADLGGGPYARGKTVPDRFELPSGARPNQSQQGVSRDHQPLGAELVHTTLSAAIDAWNVDALAAWAERSALGAAPGTQGAERNTLDRVIVIMDSRTYQEDLTRARGRCIVIPPKSRLRLIAARWPAEDDDPIAGSKKRSEGRLDPEGVRPHLLGDIEVLGVADPLGVLEGGALEIDGLLVEGSLTVLPGALESLALRHSTLVPGYGGLRVASTEGLPHNRAPAPFDAVFLGALATNAALDIELTRSIVDGISLTGSVSSLRLLDCMVHSGAERLAPSAALVTSTTTTVLGSVLTSLAAADPDIDPVTFAAVLAAIPDVDITWTTQASRLSLSGEEADADIDTTTLLGPVLLRTLEGSESLFVDHLGVRVTQEGCLRYSYAPIDSRTPRRFRCQPDLALAAAETAARDAGEAFLASDAATVRGRVRPFFTSITYGHPAYFQLARAVAVELTTGAEDGSEMGALNLLKQAHRESNLRAMLEQYLRFGLDAGFFYAT